MSVSAINEKVLNSLNIFPRHNFSSSVFVVKVGHLNQTLFFFTVSIPFFIDENTGEVNVSDQLDRETQAKYIIKVEVR